MPISVPVGVAVQAEPGTLIPFQVMELAIAKRVAAKFEIENIDDIKPPPIRRSASRCRPTRTTACRAALLPPTRRLSSPLNRRDPGRRRRPRQDHPQSMKLSHRGAPDHWIKRARTGKLDRPETTSLDLRRRSLRCRAVRRAERGLLHPDWPRAPEASTSATTPRPTSSEADVLAKLKSLLEDATSSRSRRT